MLARFVPLLLVLPALAGRASASAGEATDQVRQTVDQVLSIVQDPSLRGPAHLQERRARMREVVLQRFGFADMARRAMGPGWATLSPAQRDEYVRLFTDLLERSYARQIESYAGEPITYPSESVDGDHAEVRSVVAGKMGRTEIKYRLTRTDGHWEVYDLIINGISTVNNYRIQFGQILRGGTPADLLQRMRAKLQSEEEEETSGQGGAPTPRL